MEQRGPQPSAYDYSLGTTLQQWPLGHGKKAGESPAMIAHNNYWGTKSPKSAVCRSETQRFGKQEIVRRPTSNWSQPAHSRSDQRHVWCHSGTLSKPQTLVLILYVMRRNTWQALHDLLSFIYFITGRLSKRFRKMFQPHLQYGFDVDSSWSGGLSWIVVKYCTNIYGWWFIIITLAIPRFLSTDICKTVKCSTCQRHQSNI